MLQSKNDYTKYVNLNNSIIKPNTIVQIKVDYYLIMLIVCFLIE